MREESCFIPSQYKTNCPKLSNIQHHTDYLLDQLYIHYAVYVHLRHPSSHPYILSYSSGIGSQWQEAM